MNDWHNKSANTLSDSSSERKKKSLDSHFCEEEWHFSVLSVCSVVRWMFVSRTLVRCALVDGCVSRARLFEYLKSYFSFLVFGSGVGGWWMCVCVRE